MTSHLFPRGLLLLATLYASAIGCGGPEPTESLPEGRPAEQSPDVAESQPLAPQEPLVPSPSVPSGDTGPIRSDEIPRFAANSPFADGEPEAIKQEKRLWARSFLYSEAPEFVVEKWLSEQPDTEGKYVLIEFWATWCGPCRRSIPLLNGFHQKYGDELVVIGVSEESEADVRAMQEPRIEFYSAIDTQRRMKDQLGVLGIPHTIIVEPTGCVIWEGFPLLEGYELTDQIIERILEVGRRLRAEAQAEDG